MKTLTKTHILTYGTYTIVFLLSLICFNGVSQTTDNDIVKAILGKNIYKVNSILDSLEVWHHMHLPETIKEEYKVYSISDSKGSVKVYTLKLNDGTIVEEIIINFRHDSKEQVEDSMRIENISDFHIGKYSTDIVLQWKK